MSTENKNLVEKYLEKAKNNKIMSLIIFAGIIVIALGSFSRALKSISELMPQRQASSNVSKLPVDIGDSRASVIGKLGEPNIISEAIITGWVVDTFFAHGLVVGYNDLNEVNQITATLLRPGTSYQQSILGVKIGDEVSKCTELWGNPKKWEETPFEYSRALWEKDGYLIELQIWRKNGENENFGKYNAGAIKQIKLTK